MEQSDPSHQTSQQHWPSLKQFPWPLQSPGHWGAFSEQLPPSAWYPLSQTHMSPSTQLAYGPHGGIQMGCSGTHSDDDSLNT